MLRIVLLRQIDYKSHQSNMLLAQSVNAVILCHLIASRSSALFISGGKVSLLHAVQWQPGPHKPYRQEG